MIYIVFFLLLLGFWQMHMKGSKSEMICGVLDLLAIILLVIGLASGKIAMDAKSIAVIVLISYVILNYAVRRFKFYENLRIREIIYEYRDFKEKNPELNEDQLCRLTISERLRRHYLVYELRDNSDKQIKSYMDDVFKNELELKYVCMWFMEHEYPKYCSASVNTSNERDILQNINDWRESAKDLESRIDHYLREIPNLYNFND